MQCRGSQCINSSESMRRTKNTFTQDFPYLRCPSSGGDLDITKPQAQLKKSQQPIFLAVPAHAFWESQGKAGTEVMLAHCEGGRSSSPKTTFTATASWTEISVSANLGIKLLMSLGEALAFAINTTRKNDH